MREVWITDGPVRLFAVEDGDGPALVFLHGGLASHEAALPIVGGLADRYRVVLPDLRGSGRSRCSDALTFDRLADDLLLLLDHLGVEKAFIGGMSSGTGPAVRFALRHAERCLGLIVVWPVYAGSEIGYTSGQAALFAEMDAVASRAGEEGIEVLRPLYERLPDGMRERAWKLASGYDPGSVVATSRFIASGAQPFGSGDELASISMPTLLVRGADDRHPAEVSDVYAASISRCTVVPATEGQPAQAIGAFCDGVVAAG